VVDQAHGEIGDGGTIRFPRMEPVARPEWASPIEVGVHARDFYSVLPEQATREVLQALHGDRKLLDFLERHPLGKLEFPGRLPQPEWNGAYDPPPLADITINAYRAPTSYGHKFIPAELKTVSEAGGNLVEAIERSLYHEIGHHVLEVAEAVDPGTIDEIRKLLRSGRAMPVSKRAGQRAIEYFVESFSAYRFEDTLACKDPEGYDMVEVILKRAYKK
jgi:hypothetical protein